MPITETIFETKRLKIMAYTYDLLDEIYKLYQDKAIIKYTLNSPVAKTKEQLKKAVKMYQNAYCFMKSYRGMDMLQKLC